MKQMVIGLMGPGGAGKSTVAEYLAIKHGFARRHIARPIKRMLGSLLDEFGYDRVTIARYLDGDLKRSLIPELKVTSTQAQQNIGTELGRNLWYPEVWTDAWTRWAAKQAAAGRNLVHESVRFENEAETIRRFGGILVKIIRPGNMDGVEARHVSEQGEIEPDWVIVNDQDLKALNRQVDALVRILEQGGPVGKLKVDPVSELIV